MALIHRSSVNPQLKEGYDKLVNEHVGSSSCYGGYKELHDVLHKYCKKTDRILGPGCTCGREDFSLIEELYDAGYHSVVGIVSSDSSSSKRKKERKPGIEFVEGQLHDLKAQDNCCSESFNVVIDRGELDALHKDLSSGQRTESNIIKYFEEIQRLLKVGGRYLCFTFATVHVLDKLLDYFSSGWFFRVHLLDTQTSYRKQVPLPLFCFVLTKTKFSGQC